MSAPFACAAWLPAAACAQGDLLLYLLPSAALAFLLWIGSGAHPFFFLFTAAGTLCHELAHFSVGLLTNAEPVGMSVIPRRIAKPGKGHNWELGSVTFANLRWYNAAPAALAPLLVLCVPFAVAWWRTRGGWVFEPLDLALMFFLAPQFLSFWPSPVDWRLAARSWPYAPLLVLVLAFYFYHERLLAVVKA
ncbi:hypothetical protein B0920_07815 [Massilia sp. KIM]|uniref:hypothetical protein n=1 Tax=Massilia sp. KIM TaxID=1955422 RepID=UPI00098F1AC1|nr:hypothetical protein [Massilia sp. KIM]OON63292.1 hypothetical protein B0920_07815 [Massilia sp. KIM]